MDLKKILSMFDDEFITFDGFDEALLGIAQRFGMKQVVAYDYAKCLKILQSNGMSEEEAIEYFDFNVLGAWVGDSTPIFVTTELPEE